MSDALTHSTLSSTAEVVDHLLAQGFPSLDDEAPDGDHSAEKVRALVRTLAAGMVGAHMRCDLDAWKQLLEAIIAVDDSGDLADGSAVAAAADYFTEVRLGSLRIVGHFSAGAVVTADFTPLAGVDLTSRETTMWREAIDLVTKIWSTKAALGALPDYVAAMATLCALDGERTRIALQVMATGVATWLDDIVGHQGDAYYALGEYRKEHPDPRSTIA